MLLRRHRYTRRVPASMHLLPHVLEIFVVLQDSGYFHPLHSLDYYQLLKQAADTLHDRHAGHQKNASTTAMGFSALSVLVVIIVISMLVVTHFVLGNECANLQTLDSLRCYSTDFDDLWEYCTPTISNGDYQPAV